MEYLLPAVKKTGEMACRSKALLDKALAESSSAPQ